MKKYKADDPFYVIARTSRGVISGVEEYIATKIGTKYIYGYKWNSEWKWEEQFEKSNVFETEVDGLAAIDLGKLKGRVSRALIGWDAHNKIQCASKETLDDLATVLRKMGFDV